MSRQIVVDIVGDASKFNKATTDATDGSKKFGLSMGAIVAGGAIVTGAVIAVGAEVNKLGSQYQALDAKAKVVFGSSLSTVDKWAKANAGAMGLTAREATGLAASMGDLLVPMGFTRDQAAAMSTDIVGLSGALAEWSGGTRTSAEVSEILQKALLGERDGLKALGISITEADVKARLAKNGTDGLTGAALEQAKALATQQLLFEKSTDAQEAYKNGTAEGIRTQHEMEAQLNEVKETLVTALFPVLQTVTKFLANNLPGAIRFVQDVFTKLQPVIGAAGAVFGTLFGIIGAGAGIVTRVWDGITTGVKGGINFVIGLINGMVGKINGIQIHIPGIDTPFGKVAKFDWGGLRLGTIPYLHAGGIVPGAPGSDVVSILQAGERVTPVSQAGRAGFTIIVQGDVYGDGIDQLADKLALRLRLAGA
jgi:hypothetical protein